MPGESSSSQKIHQAFNWSIINNSTSKIGQIYIVSSGINHTIIGNMIINIGISGMFRTKVSGVNTAITYRMA